MTTHPETAQPSAAATAAATGTRRKAARADDDARTPATGSSAAAAARAPATAPLPPGCAAAACAGADDTAAEGEPVLARPHAASACPPLQEPGRSTTPAAPPPELECLRAHASLPRPPIACPAGYCKARFDGRDPHRSLRRHIKYVVDQGPGKSLHYTDHVELYQRTKAEAATSAEKQKASQKRYRESHRQARADSTRRSALRKKARKMGITDPATLDAKVDEWLRAREEQLKGSGKASLSASPSPAPQGIQMEHDPNIDPQVMGSVI